ncbi:MFS transporter [Alicyclobacillus macrosporangiidus]|uniref:MFS transporter, putative metabolite:H+ symporter n=1 Tax=Alicyclobacillus macrosporangiidus TaxID=392015 RepID=A0A1I7KYI6_9BACL|nr:MFS transporter [Alicyclobacillus macrosporangiidus]SFV02497.1 MFS transporter, putative metabolite:H+ symporter [Alicyclobacillus macrosporangiidus]
MADVAIAARMNQLPIGSMHRKITAIIGISLFFDLFDVFLAGVLGTVLTKEFHISGAAQPLLLGSAFLGMFLGAIALNGLADRIGRRRAILFVLVVYSLFTFLGAFSSNVAFLIVMRFLAGLGIGGLPPLADTYLSEMIPAAHRGRMTAWAYTLGFCAMPIEGFLARWLVPTHYGMAGWRWLFIVGSLGAIVVWLLQHHLPESPRWLESMGRVEEARAIVSKLEASAGQTVAAQPVRDTWVEPQKVPLSTLFSADFAKRTVMLWIFQILQTFGYYGFGTLVPLVLASKGITVTSSLTYLTLSFLGYPFGSLLSLPVIERIQRKWLIVLSALCMAVFGILFGMSTAPGLITAFGFLYTLSSNIFSNAFHVFQAEIYPTAIRATAAGSAYSLSRLMSGLMPFLLLPVLKAHGATAMFAVVACAMVLIMIDVGALGPRTSGRALEEMNESVIVHAGSPLNG